MLRRSISCAAAGLLMATPFWLFASQGLDWMPHKIVLVAMLNVVIAGVMALYDEMNTP
jgi:hypothetical protein